MSEDRSRVLELWMLDDQVGQILMPMLHAVDFDVFERVAVASSPRGGYPRSPVGCLVREMYVRRHRKYIEVVVALVSRRANPIAQIVKADGASGRIVRKYDEVMDTHHRSERVRHPQRPARRLLAFFFDAPA